MMGTLGCVPALDGYFATTMREKFNGTDQPEGNFRKITQSTLECFYKFYDAHKSKFKEFEDKIPVIDFDGNEIKGLFYTNAKLLDMYGWSEGKLIEKKCMI